MATARQIAQARRAELQATLRPATQPTVVSNYGPPPPPQAPDPTSLRRGDNATAATTLLALLALCLMFGVVAAMTVAWLLA